jgi:hypothetical protein
VRPERDHEGGRRRQSAPAAQGLYDYLGAASHDTSTARDAALSDSGRIGDTTGGPSPGRGRPSTSCPSRRNNRSTRCVSDTCGRSARRRKPRQRASSPIPSCTDSRSTCAAIVNDIVVEFGSARYQDVMDRFVRGANIPPDVLARAWRDTTQPNDIWDLPIYEETFRAVRDVNASLPRERQLRVSWAIPRSNGKTFACSMIYSSGASATVTRRTSYDERSSRINAAGSSCTATITSQRRAARPEQETNGRPIWSASLSSREQVCLP